MYKPGYGRYFYLEDSYAQPLPNNVKMKELVQDVKRGVKRLSEDAYCPYWGSTTSSLRFFIALRQGIDVRAKKAELRYSQKNHFTLFVETFSGYTLMFKGCSGGYYGEGSRGCYDILKACGFSEEQCQRVFEKETFTVTRRVATV